MAKACIDELRQKYSNAYMPWTGDDDRKLVELYHANVGTAELARRFGRKPSAIRSRLEKLLPPAPRTVESIDGVVS